MAKKTYSAQEFMPEFMSLHEAAALAQERTKETEIAEFAIANDLSSWHANAIALFCPIFGYRTGKTERREIKLPGGITDGGRTYSCTSKLSLPFERLEVRREDFERWLRAVADKYPKSLRPPADPDQLRVIPRENKWDEAKFLESMDASMARRKAWGIDETPVSTHVDKPTPKPRKRRRK